MARTESTTAVRLPKGVGQLPSWWLDQVPHDTRDDVLRSQRRLYRQSIGLPRESHEEETHAIELEKQRLDSFKEISSRSLGLNDVVVDQQQQQQQQQQYGHAASPRQIADNNQQEQQQQQQQQQQQEQQQQVTEAATESQGHDSSNTATGKAFKFNITMTSDEEGAAVEARRQKDQHYVEEYGQQNLRARPGNVNVVDSARLSNRSLAQNSSPTKTDAIELSPGENESVDNTLLKNDIVEVGTSDVDSSTSPSKDKSAPPPPTKKFNTAFTGVSPFDFAMQQRAREKERREKVRLSREGLAQHHGAVLLADKAAEHKARDEEERRKKKEAEEMLKMFKAADLDKTYEVAAELKKMQIETKLKKKEAEENLKGYRER